MISSTIFKEYDLRGIADTELTGDVVQKIGSAIGTFFRQRDETNVILCRDNRLSSDRIAAQISDALQKAGCMVVDIGMHPTPLCYFASQKLGISASVMITASHNPAEYNGMKICSRNMSIFGEEIRQIQRIANAGAFAVGQGSVRKYHTIENDYLADIQQRIQLAKPLHIALDTGNGSAGPVAQRLFEALGCIVEPLNIKPDGQYPNHHPDPTIPENLEDIREEVIQKHLDCGLAMDGDGDRLGVIAEDGSIIWGDTLQILFWREILASHPKADALIEVKCSQALYDEVIKLGGVPFFYKTGHSLIKAKMREMGLLFAGEMSGHMFFADEYYGFDDAVYAGARLLRILSTATKSMTQLLLNNPQYHVTPEIRIACAESKKDIAITYAREYYLAHHYQAETIDGIRVQFEDGWGLLRKSNTQPIIVMRAEASTKAGLNTIVANLTKVLEEGMQQ